MNRVADRLQPTPTRREPAPPPSTAPPLPRPPAALPPGTDAAALAELRNAAATYDFLRRKGDPTQFWEVLRLARSRRAIVAEPGGPSPAPSPGVEASILQELEVVRRQHAPMVRGLRQLLKQVPGLPDPAERLEMALAFLLASNREHQGVARWIAQPELLGAKAAEKLRSLAAITDPYREALRPWVLPATGDFEEPTQAPAGGVPRPSATDTGELDRLRLAIRCRDLLTGVCLDAELWETLVLVTRHPASTLAALDQVEEDAKAERLEEVEVQAELLFKKVAALRSEYLPWVRPLQEVFLKNQSTPEDPRLFEIAFGLAVVAPGMAARADLWSKNPRSLSQEAPDLWIRSIDRARRCQAALGSTET
ncbi:MAG TPA: hypothetical protein VMU54_05520 [Planctomycetota bacterium]|nr:hypothetical protein [Planctomycetota bacterium]